MRTLKLMFVAVIAAVGLGLNAQTHSVSAQSQIPPCSDKTNFGTILAAMSQGPFAEAYSKIDAAATPDDFANLMDLGIQTKHVLTDLSINPANDPGCFYLQLSAMSVLDDEIDVAVYQSFIKAGLKNAEAYQKGLTDSQTRLAKDNATFQALAQISIGTPVATQNP